MKSNQQIERDLKMASVAILQSEKYVVWYPPKVKYFQNDIFGIFDLIAIKQDDSSILFIQITTKSNLSNRKRKIEDFIIRHLGHDQFKQGKNFNFEIWSFEENHNDLKRHVVY